MNSDWNIAAFVKHLVGRGGCTNENLPAYNAHLAERSDNVAGFLALQWTFPDGDTAQMKKQRSMQKEQAKSGSVTAFFKLAVPSPAPDPTPMEISDTPGGPATSTAPDGAPSEESSAASPEQPEHICKGHSSARWNVLRMYSTGKVNVTSRNNHQFPKGTKGLVDSPYTLTPTVELLEKRVFDSSEKEWRVVVTEIESTSVHAAGCSGVTRHRSKSSDYCRDPATAADLKRSLNTKASRFEERLLMMQLLDASSDASEVV